MEMHNEINLPTYQIMRLQTTEIWISVYDTTNFNDPTVYICESHQLLFILSKALPHVIS